MENVNDKNMTSKTESERESDKWDAYDEYDCKPPKVPFSKEYSESLWPAGVKEAIAKRKADLQATPGKVAAELESTNATAGIDSAEDWKPRDE
jgi:hypothetical protein